MPLRLNGFYGMLMLGLTGCGGASDGGGTVPGSAALAGADADATPRSDQGPSLVDGEYTTEVDEARLSATAPVSTEFLPDTPEMFFIGKLSFVPAESEIEVRWTRATEGEPFYATRKIGSGDVTVLSRFSPEKESLSPGQYWTVVTVNGRPVGKRSFRIVSRRSGAMLSVKELKVALAIDDKQRAVSPSESLPKGSKKVYASFFVSGVEQGASIRVKWYRDDNLLDEIDLESKGENRYSTVLAQKKSLPIGNYAVEVEILGDVYARRSFYVGDSSGSPVIEQAALGLKIGRNRLPKPSMETFKPGTRAIKCGIQFAFVPDNSKVEVKWVSLVGGTEDVLHTSEAVVKHGGDSTVGLGWNPGKKLPQGPYKAVIVVNSVDRKELPFSIK